MTQAIDKEELMRTGRLLSQKEVAQMLGCSLEYVSRLTNASSENARLPAFAFGRRKMYAYDEILWWRDKHRYVPRRKGKR